MPPKTVRCCICGQDVFKSRTYATGDKDEEGNPLRACKEHEGIVEKAEELKKKSLEEGKRSREKLGWKPPTKEEIIERQVQSFKEQEEFATWAWEHCWCCEQPGLHLQDFYELKLIALEKGRILGKDNPFSPEMEKIIAGLMRQAGVKCVVHRFELDEKMREKYNEWKNRIYWKCRPLAEMMGIIQLCFDCQKRTGIEFDLEGSMPKLDLKTMAVFGALYDGSEAQKAIKTLAVASALKDQEDTAKKIQNH